MADSRVTVGDFVSFVQDKYDQDATLSTGRAGDPDENVVDLSAVISEIQADREQRLQEESEEDAQPQADEQASQES